MDEEKGIKIDSMYLNIIIYEWWHNDITTLGHRKVKTFKEFSKSVLDRFEHKHRGILQIFIYALTSDLS